MSAAAGNKASHPVEIECPACRQRFRVPLNDLSAGVRLPCLTCKYEITIATPVMRQLLREIDKDLRTPDDLPIILRPNKNSLIAKRDGITGKAGKG